MDDERIQGWESWTKIFSIDIGSARGSCDGFYQPVLYLDNGALVMFNSPHNELVYYDESRGLRFKYFGARCRQPDIEIIFHTPNSFMSLKDIVKNAPVKFNALNVNSRYAQNIYIYIYLSLSLSLFLFSSF